MKFRDELKWIIPIVAVCLLAFANSLGGEFVYDDLRQIVRNPLIQDDSLIWKALTSDVWAFKAYGTAAASNYWRPTFTLWHILNFRLFGANPYGWHIMNLLLHTGVCVLSYFLMRRWAITPMIACAVALIFAVHPVHVESVAWVSGSPDLLFALAFLGSLWFAQNYADKSKTKDLIISLLLYAAALGAKEIGILCLPIYFVIFYNGEKKKNISFFDARTFSFIAPFIAAAAIYFFSRLFVLGMFSSPPDGSASFGEAILSVPHIFVFYLRQIFFPYWLSVNYPLQTVSQIEVTNFVLPLIVALAALGGVYYLARHVVRSKTALIAAMLFILPLVPVMNARFFPPGQLVHDRYLYLPLLGILMLMALLAASFVKEKYILTAGAVISLLLCFQTFTYNTAWANELALWSWSARVDRGADTLSQYGSELSERGKIDEAIQVYTESLSDRPLARSYLGRGRNLVLKKKYAEAEKDLVAILQLPPEKLELYVLYQTYEALAISYSDQKKYVEAVEMLREARKQLPMFGASLTANLAIVLYQSGQKEEALRELESVRAQARTELLPEAKSVFLRLGMLYAELGRKDDARGAVREYLNLTSSFKDKTTLEDRAAAANLLKSLN
ncbi:MAG TPA: tetratricopeptide repeat protein [Pyrinomonadaceae bacterium]|jgi:tetratricopeptide (TPR) repeat protein|nr:tetratricopeptide repeat protein [Pyrinomonadaceae bacterium]